QGVGPSGPPPAGWLTAVAAVAVPAPSVDSWVGRVASAGLIERASPTLQAAVRQTLPPGTAVNVVAWVMGDELVGGDWTWAKLADGGYAYGESMQIIPPTSAPPPPVDHPSGGGALVGGMICIDSP